MRYLSYLAAIAVLAQSAAPAASSALKARSSRPVLWHGVRVGMTEAQLRAVLPNLERDPRNNDFLGPETEVNGMKLTVGVEMLGGRVARVILASEHALPSILEDALRAKYGNPMKPYRCEAGVIYLCDAVWAAPAGVQVGLEHVDVQGGGMTSVTYSAPDSSGLE